MMDILRCLSGCEWRTDPKRGGREGRARVQRPQNCAERRWWWPGCSQDMPRLETGRFFQEWACHWATVLPKSPKYPHSEDRIEHQGSKARSGQNQPWKFRCPIAYNSPDLLGFQTQLSKIFVQHWLPWFSERRTQALLHHGPSLCPLQLWLGYEAKRL